MAGLGRTVREDFVYYHASLKRDVGAVNTILLLLMGFIDWGMVLVSVYDPEYYLFPSLFVLLNLYLLLWYGMVKQDTEEYYRVIRMILRMGALAVLLWFVKIMFI